ncbi:MAG: cytochrome C oxidase subunit IV family protein [Armatimonadetes bacterium]|nr:cytochrome C oxidase subunit IV family protein [Armatimonadota bacterium]
MAGKTHQPHYLDDKTYFMVFGALMVFLFLTVGAAQVDLGAAVNNVIALAIAIIKAYIVVKFFMGVKMATKLTFLWAVAGFVCLLILFGLAFSDYGSRGWVDHNPGW